MTAGDARRVKAVFELALDAPESVREEVLARECGGDADLRLAVEALLRAVSEMGDFLETPAADQLLGAASQSRLAPGERVADFTVTGVLGEGGGGVVYEAEQREPRRAVALKMMRGGARSRGALRTFQQEAASLARLQHPGIAHVYAAGTFDRDGGPQPWIAMERVEGARSIVRHAREEELPRDAKLRLFLGACEAIQHAHQKGVIHRDVTPGNVLVDSEGRPKVVDFGVACGVAAGDERPSDAVGTLAYASPEQLAGDAAGVDVRADVYGLGALLFELLTGSPPHDVDRLAFAEVARLKRDVPAPAPSSRAPGIPRDLDAVVLKALAVDRDRRYGTAAALAEDVERFLAGEPVAAFRGGAAYKLGKFARRRRGTAAAIAAVVAAVVGGAAAAVWYSVESAAARAAAEHSSYVANISAAAAALRVDDAAEARRRLALAPQRLRDWEWRHLLGRTDVSEATLTASQAELRDGAASADGSLVAVAGTDGFSGSPGVLRWSGEKVFEWGSAGNAPSVAMTPDGRWFAAGFKDGSVRLADLPAAVQRVREHAHAGPVIDLAFDADGGRLLTGGADGRALLLRVPELDPIREFEGHADRVVAVAFDAAGGRAATGCRDGTIRIFDAGSGVVQQTLTGHAGSVESVAFSPDGARLFSGSRDRTVRLWDVASGRMISLGTSHGSNVRRVAFSPAGDVCASASWDGTVRLWDGADGGELGILRGHGGPVAAVEFVRGGAGLVSFSWDGTVKRWDVRRTEVASFRGADDTFSGIAFDATGTKLAACCRSGAVFVLDASDASILWRERSARPLHGVQFAQEAIDRDATMGTCDVWRPPGVAGSLVAHLSFMTFDAASRRACFLRRNFATEGPSVVALVDLAARRDERLLTSSLAVTSVARDPASELVAAGCKDGSVVIWRAGASRSARVHADSVERVVFGAAGDLLLTCSTDATAKVLRTSDLSEVVALRGHASSVRDGAFLPGGRRIVTVSRDQTVRIWDAASGENLLVLHGHGYPVECVAVSADGTRIATGAGSPEDAHSNVRIWSAPSDAR